MRSQRQDLHVDLDASRRPIAVRAPHEAQEVRGHLASARRSAGPVGSDRARAQLARLRKLATGSLYESYYSWSYAIPVVHTQRPRAPRGATRSFYLG